MALVGDADVIAELKENLEESYDGYVDIHINCNGCEMHNNVAVDKISIEDEDIVVSEGKFEFMFDFAGAILEHNAINEFHFMNNDLEIYFDFI